MFKVLNSFWLASMGDGRKASKKKRQWACIKWLIRFGWLITKIINFFSGDSCP